MMALDALCSAVLAEMVPGIADKETAKEAWQAIKTLRVGDDRVRKSSAQTLRQQFDSTSFKDGESVEDFSLRLSSMAATLKTLGDKVDETKQAEKLLRSMPRKFQQIVVASETLLDVSSLSLADVTGWLKAAEDAEETPPSVVQHDGKLYFTEEEWEARRRKRDAKKQSGDGSSSSSGMRRRGGRRGRGRGRGSPSSGGPSNNYGKATSDECRRCGKLGHWAQECKSKPRRKQAHVVQDEAEASLLFLRTLPEPTVLAPNQSPARLAEVARSRPDAGTRGSKREAARSGEQVVLEEQKAVFEDLDTMVCGSVRFGDDSVTRIEGRGTVMFRCKNGEKRSFAGVYFIPRLTMNIISLGQLDEVGYKIDIDSGVLRIREPGRQLLAKGQRATDRLYLLRIKVAQLVCLAVRGDKEAWLWHARFGHVHMAALRKLAREDMVRGLPEFGQAEGLCEACQAGKQWRSSFPAEAHRFMWVAAIPSKDRAAAAIKEFQTKAEGEARVKLRALRIDRGDEFTSAEFAEYCIGEGVYRQHTAPYSPQQNGVVERRNRTVVATARSMLKAKGLPGWFWSEAVNTAVYVVNRSPIKSVEGRTLFKAWYGKKPTVHHLRTFGCIVYVRNTVPHLKKLEDRGRKMIFVGYEKGTKAYRAYDLVTKKVHITRDVVFDEQDQWDWSIGDRGADVAGEDMFTVEYVSQASPVAEATFETPGAASPAAAASPQPDLGVRSAENYGEATGLDENDNLDADHDEETPLRYRAVTEVIGPGSPPGYAVCNLGVQRLYMVGAEEPTSFAEAEQEACWRKAMLEELQAIEENRTWTLTELPSGRRAVGLKWVFKVKKDEKGAVVRHKARLVVKGYAQRRGIDYDEVFALVARMEVVRLLIALAAHEGWEVHHMDVKSAFLNGDLEEEFYVQQPPGLEQAGQEHKVYKLHKALYGLHQAPRAWNQKQDASLITLGFVKCPSDHAIYCRGSGVERLIVGVYVDDLVITGTCGSIIREFKKQMADLFKMSDLGLLSYYLGLEVTQSEQGISLSQRNYARKILEKGGMLNCNPCQVPMEARLKLSKDSSSPPVDATEYRSLVGSLRYLVHTRPDLAFSVGYVSRFMEEPHAEHLAAVNHILRYIAGTCNMGLWYARKKNQQHVLMGFSDSDLAGDIDSRRITSGVIFFLGDSAVSWQSAKQKVVSVSSCEAEYIAATTAACQGAWLARLLGEFLDSEVGRPVIKVDNKSAISLVQNPVHHDRSKHIDIRFHFITKA
ncbi:hypothetical protein QOZ80_UnG0725510 [Eleusine coracana subsp. coracana]|uniref:Uncharacterized protein n=1 Tax=Eleusine coracana subsp. coracana TaxID=191504 RepID=A0AAV9FVS7_ELECO|nr:hypothetical protein QOZ80_UnG0725510 [Eleusine coracana subsp. coracana]